MSLQRGSYGIEYDEGEGTPLRKFRWLIFFILIPAATALFFRGCGESSKREVLDDGALGQTRYRLSEVEPSREPPARLNHFFWARHTSTQTKDASTVMVSETPTVARQNAETRVPRLPTILQSSGVRALLQQVTVFEEADNLIEARKLLHQLLLRRDAGEVREFVERKLGTINTTLIFSNRAMPEKKRHRVVARNVISRLAKQYGNTQAFLLKVNEIKKPEALRLGREIWVLENPVFELTIFKRSLSAVLTLNGLFFKRYEISFGNQALIPLGTYAIRSRVENPSYQTSDNQTVGFGHSQNLLGTRWVSLIATGATPIVTGLGLHGTQKATSRERQSETGRVRFSNADIEEICLLMPDGTAINITD